MIIAVLAVVGLCMGSFVNALVYRIHEQDRHKKPPKELSITKGRSMCPHCKHELAAKDLIPVLSWLSLGGKCRYCGAKIDDTPLTEIATALLFVTSYIWWPYSFNAMGTFNFVVWLVLLVGFVALFLYDRRWMLLPNRIVFPLMWLNLGALAVNLAVFKAGWSFFVATLLATLVTSGVFFVLFQLSNGRWIGGGDVKLGLVIGLTLQGFWPGCLVLFFASLLGTAIALPGLFSGKMSARSKLPFGPLLIVGAIIAKLFGTSLVAWYKHHLLAGF
jgi:prepilin signal peptidase PulO-like enzyme (type II secretory pathway)